MNATPAHQHAVQGALDLARRGLAVFPIEPWARIPPVGWQKSATTDPATIRYQFAWFSRFINQAAPANVGVACRASRIVVLDLDRHTDGPDGIAGWDALCARNDETDPGTLTVVTPNGGLHLYFQAPADVTITSSSGPRAGLPAGIDVRAPGRRSGGYVMGPGSQTQAGRYRIARDAPVLGLPDWLATTLTTEATGRRAP